VTPTGKALLEPRTAPNGDAGLSVQLGEGRGRFVLQIHGPLGLDELTLIRSFLDLYERETLQLLAANPPAATEEERE
jgi:hypothetical protein